MYKSGGIREFSSPRPLAPGIPETRLFPVQTWERLERQVLKEYRHRALEQSPPQGTERLRRAIASMSIWNAARMPRQNVSLF
jgi:GntR family transcriptional regulator/MocR family aminotransferase